MVVARVDKITPTVVWPREVAELIVPNSAQVILQPMFGHYSFGKWFNPQDDSRFVLRVAGVIHMGNVYDAGPG